MMGQLHNLKQVIGDPAQENTGPVPVKETVGKPLHVGEHIGTHVGLHQGPVAVADHRYLILEKGPQQISGQHSSHDREKSRVHLLGKEAVHSLSGDIREGQIDKGNQSRKEHIQCEELLMGKHVRDENGKI